MSQLPPDELASGDASGEFLPANRRELAKAAKEITAYATAVGSLASWVIDAPNQRRNAARVVYDRVLERTVGDELNNVPIERLKETTQGRARLGVIESAGFKTVAQVISAGEYRLQMIRGVGPESSARVVAAARQLQAALRDTVRVRLDSVERPKDHSELLAALWSFGIAARNVAQAEPDLAQLRTDFEARIPAASLGASLFKLMFASRSKRDAIADAVSTLRQRVDLASGSGIVERLQEVSQLLQEGTPTADELWDDYRGSAAYYNGLLIEVGGLEADEAAAHGFLPGEIAERVNAQPLDLSMLRNISLRGYQAFGAKFALCQSKVILGDEMGLGKTIEALAALSHLRSQGSSHFLVVSPASVLVNWAHEVERHSYLTPLRLHGFDRGRNMDRWIRDGGVGITTYQTLQSLRLPAVSDLRLSMLVVDEAHYVKNPEALRTRNVEAWIRRSDHVLFMTGTPMENRVEEFRSLVGQLQPSVARAVRSVDGVAGAARFRQVVSPAYLRRDQKDVLDELPEKIETEEWVQLGGDDFTAYRDAVRDKNFMAMRRAAYAPGRINGSAKLERLSQIVDEAMWNERKIVVFSYFRDVIATVISVLGNRAVGPITGSVPPGERQAILDTFTSRRNPAVLVSQIEAGGVGLNMQAASVVILTEPQWKPSTEVQAIARCHRMGQAQPVDVHRLLAENSVDQRMLEVLARKQSLIDAYVPSAVKQASPEAVDVSDLETTKEAASQVEAERRIIEIERKRLGLVDDE